MNYNMLLAFIFIFYLCQPVFSFVNINSIDNDGVNATCTWKKCRLDAGASSNCLKVYWINVESNTNRRSFMEEQLKQLNFPNERINAIVPSSPGYNISLLQKPCKRNTEKDLACILSHLTAIHRAIYDESNDANSDYALIMEVLIFSYHNFVL
jgi:hypothetical protein